MTKGFSVTSYSAGMRRQDGGDVGLQVDGC